MRLKASLHRFTGIFLIAARHMLIQAVHQGVKRWSRLDRRISGERLTGPRRFRLAIEETGGTFIKFGQMLAMQSDMLPLNYCAALFSLFDQVAPFDYSKIEQTILEDLGQRPPEIFEHFEREPIATGSIGQVHVAVLNGRKVAVKVRRPTIVSDFDADITAMKFVVRLVKLLHFRKLYWIIAPTEEFIAWTEEELDYRREAHYMDELGWNARNNAFEQVPTVFWSCTTARILTVEYLEGITVSEYLRQKNKGPTNAPPDLEPSLFAARLIDNFLGDAFRHGMFHADLHPGNLMILPNNVVGYIDFGISGVLSRYSRRHIIAMTLAYARGDLDAMCESFFRITTFDTKANPQGFRHGLQEAASAWYGEQENANRLRKSITSIMLDLLILSRKNGIWPQRDVVKYIRSAIALDGLIKTFAPGMDIGRHLETACERHIKWESLRNLISADAISNWAGSYAHLALDGAVRAVTALRRMQNESSTPGLNFAPARQVLKQRSRRIIQLGWVGLCIVLMWKPVPFNTLQISALLMLLLVVLAAWQHRATHAVKQIKS